MLSPESQAIIDELRKAVEGGKAPNQAYKALAGRNYKVPDVIALDKAIDQLFDSI